MDPSSPFHTTVDLSEYSNPLMVSLPGYVAGCASFLPGFYCLQEERRPRGDHIAVRSGIVGSP